MNRLQISLTEDQYAFLKSESFVLGKSMAAVLRDLLNQVITARCNSALEADPIWQVIGIGHKLDAPTDISTHIDHYLYGHPLPPATSNQSLDPEPLVNSQEEIDSYQLNQLNHLTEPINAW